MSKPTEKNKARSLRKKGYSLKEISESLNVSKSSVSIWCSDIELNEEQKKLLHEKMVKGSYAGRVIGAQMNKDKKKKKIEECLIRARKDVGKITNKEFFVAGLSFYWGEGAKNGSNVRFYNSDPEAITFMMKWFREFLHVDDSRFLMHININSAHKNRLSDVVSFWEGITGIPSEQFKKPVIIKTKNKKIFENFSNHYGTLSIRISKSQYLLYQILAWIDVLKKAG